MTSAASSSSSSQGVFHAVRSRKRDRSEQSTSLDSLHILGYKVFNSVFEIPESIMQEVVTKSKEARPIFNQNEKAKNDRRRLQYTLTKSKTSKAMQRFLQSLNKFAYEYVSEILKPAPWVVLHSKPGCQDQAAHCDFIPELSLSTASDEQMPLSMIVVMMPNTRINIWPNSIRLPSLAPTLLGKVRPIKCKGIDLDVGDVLIFRGDLVHAGSSYESDNYRLHTYLDSDSVLRRPNRTWLVHTHADPSLAEVILPKG